MMGLAFSGGKDSLACLYLYKNQLKDITVLWVNTDKNFPETLTLFEEVKLMCPNFVEIKSSRSWQNYINGLPSDIIPFANTVLGSQITGEVETKVQSYFQCCHDNISAPLMAKVKELGITSLISGKRLYEGHISSNMDGDVVDGVIQVHPIEHWTEKEVLDYLAENIEVPEHFKFKHSSLDCYDCTAYRNETKDIDEWAKVQHPDLYQIKTVRLDQLRSVLIKRMESI